jgi:anion-transporting  ArsA/GET3 family ATPase
MEQKLIVTAGPGGVGKTTTAAALALRAAKSGRRALVLTIDPAKRLATSLGLDNIPGEPTRIALSSDDERLWAMSLDTRRTFDSLIKRLSPDEETADRVIQSRLYGIFAGSMHGTSEYMALENLHDVYTSGDFDLVVLDTPPLTNALDFFNVPKRASWIFDDRVMRWFLPHRAPKGLRAVLNPGAVVVALLKRLAGESLVDDITEFFSALEIVRDALKQRGDAVARILQGKDTSYVIVTGPDSRRIREALFLNDQFERMKQHTSLFLVNRSHDHFVPSEGGGLEKLPKALEGFDIDSLMELGGRLAVSGARHRAILADLVTQVGRDRVCVVPDFEDDVYQIEQLTLLAEHLVRV